MLEDMKLGELLNLVNAINSSKYQQNETQELKYHGNTIRIVILQRGWVVVGRYFQRGSDCWVGGGYVIRQWGTDKGLGQLAIEGKQENTKLDKIPNCNFHELTVVASIECDYDKWKEICG